jgi:hypothetical protein
MRILFFLHNVSKTRHFEAVLAGLARRGHTIVLAAERQRNRALSLPKNLIVANRQLIAQGARGRIEITASPVRRTDAWQEFAPALRRLRDYSRFLDPRYAAAEKLEARASGAVPKGWRAVVKRQPAMRRNRRLLARALAVAEDAIPSDRFFELFIEHEQADVVLVTPLVDYGSYQTDVVKAAHRLGVPVAFLPFSWDNLTNRGLVRVVPDRMLVWNDIQLREAVELHDVPADRVVVVGAPRFDDFYAMSPSSSRDDFCHQIGLDPARPFFLYVCSSEFVAPHEVDFVRRWIAALRNGPHPALRDCGVLVRPHPAHQKQWATAGFAETNVAVWTTKETMNADQGLYDSLWHCAAVVGLNTSAMLEAGILGKPVYTIITSEFAGGQSQTLHFGYLRASNGGLLNEAATMDEHLDQLSRALAGTAISERAAAFVERFVRPHGRTVPVAPLMIDEIERLASLEKRPRRWRAPWLLPVRGILRGVMRLRSRR